MTDHGRGRKVLLLHGNRQTGELLLGRLAKLRKRLSKELRLELVAPDAPLQLPTEDDRLLLTWWNRVDNDYQGLDRTLEVLRSRDHSEIVGIMGFSQGARLCHLLALLHHQQPDRWFPGLRFVVCVAGYQAPLPDHHFPATDPGGLLSIPSLHVWGEADPLVRPEQSEAVAHEYRHPRTHIHPGKHFVPTKAADLEVYIDFIRNHVSAEGSPSSADNTPGEVPRGTPRTPMPDEEAATLQQDEVYALEAIFPEELHIQSETSEQDDEIRFQHPIVFRIDLIPTEDDGDRSQHKWPVHPLALRVEYPHNYPLETIPVFELIHENNSMEFPSRRSARVMAIVNETARMEVGMPCVLSCIYAAKEYLDEPPSEEEEPEPAAPESEEEAPYSTETDDQETIQKCCLEGLEIAERILEAAESKRTSDTIGRKGGNGGSWNYVIGLVGKPSAGKSTFFNAATAFSRQRGSGGEEASSSEEWGGASMAAHPFTTIDPNIGYCLIPAPDGSCPEDSTAEPSKYGSTHGRTPDGRRFLPVLLKDVAGLVPGAWQGRGKGNKFLDDLTDATVLVHVVDASGTADAQGNKTVTDDRKVESSTDLTNPLDDLSWIRNELVEWVYSNITAKWDSIQRKGRSKLSAMFSGYGGLKEAEVQTILTAIENFLEENYDRDRALQHLDKWNQGDIHRLVSAFLGVRFAMALALNKCDLPTSQGFVQQILSSLPIHGAHSGTPMTAQKEMLFVRHHLKNSEDVQAKAEVFSPPTNVWSCLTSAMALRQPVLVFPVSDLTTLAPLASLSKRAAEVASLPSGGMIRCIKAAGGKLPSCWNESQEGYSVPSKTASSSQILRDVMIMKQGSTVEDVFTSLKGMGAIGGEFVRAEAMGEIHGNPKPISKLEVIGPNSRIIKIMSNKRTAWQ